jgi:hypothetical protein
MKAAIAIAAVMAGVMASGIFLAIKKPPDGSLGGCVSKTRLYEYQCITTPDENQGVREEIKNS